MFTILLNKNDILLVVFPAGAELASIHFAFQRVSVCSLVTMNDSKCMLQL